MSDLTLEELAGIGPDNIGHQPPRIRRAIIAAARAHLEKNQDWFCEHGVSMDARCQHCIEAYGCGRKTAPQPPQCPVPTNAHSYTPTPVEPPLGCADAPPSAYAMQELASHAKPSPDAGLVEQLRAIDVGHIYNRAGLFELVNRAAAALEALEESKTRLRGWLENCKDRAGELEDALEAKDAEIKSWEKQWRDTWAYWNKIGDEYRAARATIEAQAAEMERLRAQVDAYQREIERLRWLTERVVED